jgi:hypothetical protein
MTFLNDRKCGFEAITQYRHFWGSKNGAAAIFNPVLFAADRSDIL